MNEQHDVPEDIDAPVCTCGHLRFRDETTDIRILNFGCTEHGVDSAWWHSEEQEAARQRAHDDRMGLLRSARERSKAGHPSNYRPQS